MPKSKRDKVVTLSKRKKENKKHDLVQKIQNEMTKHKYLHVFQVEGRGTELRLLRAELNDSKIFFGRAKVMQKAVDIEYEGQTGLLFTSLDADAVGSMFVKHSVPEFAIAGDLATEDVHLSGTLPFKQSMEAHLKSLGLDLTIVDGTVHLTKPHIVCKIGEPLTSSQSQILKLLGVRMSKFRISLRSTRILE